jgi:hypothetical protein
MLQNAPPCACLPVGRGGDECSDFKNPIGRTFLSGNRIFAETGKSRLSVKPRPVGGVLYLILCVYCNLLSFLGPSDVFKNHWKPWIWKKWVRRKRLRYQVLKLDIRIKELLGDGLIKSSEEVARGSIWKFFYPFWDICLNRMRWRIIKRVFLETITTCTSAKSHFIDVSLVYWKTFAHLQSEFFINTAKSLSRQHGANKNEGATSSALMAFPSS